MISYQSVNHTAPLSDRGASFVMRIPSSPSSYGAAGILSADIYLADLSNFVQNIKFGVPASVTLIDQQSEILGASSVAALTPVCGESLFKISQQAQLAQKMEPLILRFGDKFFFSSASGLGK